jgi:hypothetical protein
VPRRRRQGGDGQLRAQHRERRPERAEVGYADFKQRFWG